MELKGHLLYYPEGKHDINLNNYVQKSQLNDAIKSKVDSITKTTYADLKNLRDNSQLVPGNLYRITDYQCTTTQENTRSAGHQFDIVLLALSENKLAEEGWAMMHDNIYDVTFADGVTKKCWIYKTPDFDNIVDINTLLGTQDISLLEDANINEETKTIIITNEQYTSSYLSVEDIPYNYFQNSNLSAWKVWYCLDNDKSRFAWADDSVDNGYVENIYRIIEDTTIYYVRNSSKDTVYKGDQYYCWENINNASGLFFTISDNPEIGDYIYDKDKGGSMNRVGSVEHVTRHEGTGLPNGRGVIYRLIDEWNNDVPWDFKNIMFTLNNETTYSLSVADQDLDYEYDATLAGATLGVIVQTTHGESKQGRTPKSIYPISRVMLQQCLIYLNKDISLDSYLFTNNGHANIIYGLEIYNPNA